MPDSKDKQTPVATAGVAAAQAKLSAAQSAVPNLAAPETWIARRAEGTRLG